MNTETGQLVPSKELKKMLPADRAKYVEVKRDLTLKEAADMQIRLYSPCGCGSGKKFKFCCHQKKRTEVTPNDDLRRSDGAQKNSR